MAAIDRTAYPRFKNNLSDQELIEFYTPSPAELELAHKNALGPRPVLSFLILLKSFQRLGYFPNLKEVPQPIKFYLSAWLAVPPDTDKLEPLATPRRTKSLYRYHAAIRAYLKIRVYDQEAEALATSAVLEAAQAKSNPADLINVALEILIKERYELPAFSTLDRLVQRLRTTVNTQFCEKVLNRLFVEDRQRLDAMLRLSVTKPVDLVAGANRPLSTVEPETEPAETEWARLKQVPQSASLTHLQELQERYTWLLGLVDPDKHLAGLPPGKVKDFAAQARALKAGELLRYSGAWRYTLSLCLIQQARVSTRDNLVDTFLKRMAFFHSRAKAELEALRQRQRETTEKLVGALAEILQVNENALCQEDLAVFGKLAWRVLARQGSRETLLHECEGLQAYNNNNYLPLLHRYYHSHRATLFRLARSLQFVATTQDQQVKEALTYLLQHEDNTAEYRPYADLKLSFASEPWRKLLIVTHEGEQKLVRRQLEVCIFSYLASELRNGDIAVTDSEKYLDYRQQLLSWSECQPLLADYSAQVKLPTDPKEFVRQLKEQLLKRAAEVDAFYPDNTQFVIDEKGEPILKKTPSRIYSKNLKKLEAYLRERMPSRSVLEILGNVQYYTNFTRHFGPPSGSDPKLDKAVERYLLTTFCYGCNLGPVQLVKHLLSEVSAQQLAFAHYRHVDLERLLSARADIINAYARFELPGYWGDGSRVAADGTKVELARNNLVSEFHIRYGGYGGIFYRFISDTYIALFSSFITCGVWEGSYIFDLFSKNKSDFSPTIIHSDTQGQNLPGFGLSYLLGVELMPRIRNFKDLIFFRPDKATHYQHIDSLFTDELNWELIEQHLPDLLRVALSIKTGKVLPSTLLRRLNNYSHKNKLYQAMRELGRAVRTFFMLGYLVDGELRVEVTNSTNKVESFHNFAQFFHFGGHGVLYENDPVEQEKRTHYLDLVADAAIYQNVVDMSRIIQKLAAEGLEFDQEDLAALSPYLTRHIKRFGEYVIDLSKVPDPWDGKLELAKHKAARKTGS